MTEDTDLQVIDDDFPRESSPRRRPTRRRSRPPSTRRSTSTSPGLVVRKDLVKTVKGNAIVPSYVLEYLLGQYAASDDEATIQAGIDSVQEILRRALRPPQRGRAGAVDHPRARPPQGHRQGQRRAQRQGRRLRGRRSPTSASRRCWSSRTPSSATPSCWSAASGASPTSSTSTATTHASSPWILGSIKPIQLSHFDFDGYVAARREFTTDEWIDLLIQTIGFNPELFGRRAKLIQLVRLIPFCERNYNLIELGPKGTGKSHIYSEFSPHGILISGGEVTVPKLFVNNSNGRIGLVGYWDVVAFDEFAGKKKRADKALVDIMKNYMANKSFSRGIETLGAEASMVFVGNTQHTVPYMLKHSDLFDELPERYHDSAFLDRLHFYIPGWEVDIIRGEMFSDGYGFVVDYLAEILKSMRNADYSDRYQQHFTLGSDISTRDRDGIDKTFSGLMKILYPHGEATHGGDRGDAPVRHRGPQARQGPDPAHRLHDGRRQVRLPRQGRRVARRHHARGGRVPDVLPPAAARGRRDRGLSRRRAAGAPRSGRRPIEAAPKPEPLFEGHREFQENQRGVSYETLLLPYLRGATEITIVDPYIRQFHQGRNLVDLLELLASAKDPADEICGEARDQGGHRRLPEAASTDAQGHPGRRSVSRDQIQRASGTRPSMTGRSALTTAGRSSSVAASTSSRRALAASSTSALGARSSARSSPSASPTSEKWTGEAIKGPPRSSGQYGCRPVRSAPDARVNRRGPSRPRGRLSRAGATHRFRRRATHVSEERVGPLLVFLVAEGSCPTGRSPRRDCADFGLTCVSCPPLRAAAAQRSNSRAMAGAITQRGHALAAEWHQRYGRSARPLP